MVLFLQFPVYFAFENEETDAMLADVKKNDALGQQATATTGGLVNHFLNDIYTWVFSFCIGRVHHVGFL